ncbi:MAG: trypsin-like peptidase domain-containing protein [Chloroflexi bacterium]|nr:trypsin-like peptidase domain-containing protein [Chloroflexota bacterium]
MRRIPTLLVTLSLVLSLIGPLTALPVHAEPDFPVASGHFYTQASPNGAAGFGFRVTDDGGIPFWSLYQQLGGPDVLGYPISKRFQWQGFVHQATEKAILQWQPDAGFSRVAFVNVFDELSDAGQDNWLLIFKSTPKPNISNAGEAGQSLDAITASRLAILDGRPAIKAKYFSVAGSIDPVLLYGLPTSSIQDLGNSFVVRLQRAVIQEWTQDTPWAKAGEVTVANGGSIALEAGIIPPAAKSPELPPIGGEPDLPALSPDAEQVANTARPAVVKITLPNGDFGSGFIVDPKGLILTNAHVVERANIVRVRLPDGRSFDGLVRGRDGIADVALVSIQAQGLPTVRLGNSDTVQPGDSVVAIGYTPVVPGAPSSRIGVVRDLAGNPPFGGAGLFEAIGSDTFIHPGDSGGPLLNLRGEVVGINTAIFISDSPMQTLQASSLAINVAKAFLNSLR